MREARYYLCSSFIDCTCCKDCKYRTRLKPLYAAGGLRLWAGRGRGPGAGPGRGGGPAPGMAAMGRAARGWARSQPCALALAAALAVCAFYYLGGGGETFSSATRRLRATPPAPAHRHPQRPAGEAAAAAGGRDLHLLMMFTKAERSPALRAKGQAALRSLLRHGRLGGGDALHLHLVTEGASRDIGLGLLRDLLRGAAFRHQVRPAGRAAEPGRAGAGPLSSAGGGAERSGPAGLAFGGASRGACERGSSSRETKGAAAGREETCATHSPCSGSLRRGLPAAPLPGLSGLLEGSFRASRDPPAAAAAAACRRCPGAARRLPRPGLGGCVAAWPGETSGKPLLREKSSCSERCCSSSRDPAVGPGSASRRRGQACPAWRCLPKRSRGTVIRKGCRPAARGSWKGERKVCRGRSASACKCSPGYLPEKRFRLPKT